MRLGGVPMPRDYQREYRKNCESSTVFQIRIKPELKESFFERCKDDGVVPSQWIIEQIKNYINH